VSSFLKTLVKMAAESQAPPEHPGGLEHADGQSFLAERVPAPERKPTWGKKLTAKERFVLSRSGSKTASRTPFDMWKAVQKLREAHGAQGLIGQLRKARDAGRLSGAEYEKAVERIRGGLKKTSAFRRYKKPRFRKHDPAILARLKEATKSPLPRRQTKLAFDPATNIVQGMLDKRRQIAKLAGHAKEHTTFDGLRVALEHVPGDVRSGVSKDGTKWSRKMYDCYGYVPRTYGMGADGEAIDVYLAKEPVEGSMVFKLRQMKKEGGFDEDKYMLGFPSAAAAKKAYLRHMPDWAFGSMTGTTMRSFRANMTRKQNQRRAS
jgi:hypothetical protein